MTPKEIAEKYMVIIELTGGIVDNVYLVEKSKELETKAEVAVRFFDWSESDIDELYEDQNDDYEDVSRQDKILELASYEAENDDREVCSRPLQCFK